jgi:hypothetical protein
MIIAHRIADALERAMVAATFAEAGDRKTALEIMREEPVKPRKHRSVKIRKHVYRRPVLRA